MFSLKVLKEGHVNSNQINYIFTITSAVAKKKKLHAASWTSWETDGTAETLNILLYEARWRALSKSLSTLKISTIRGRRQDERNHSRHPFNTDICLQKRMHRPQLHTRLALHEMQNKVFPFRDKNRPREHMTTSKLATGKINVPKKTSLCKLCMKMVRSLMLQAKIYSSSMLTYTAKYLLCYKNIMSRH